MKPTFLLITFLCFTVFGQSQMTVEINTGIGYSAVDVEGIVEVDEIANTIAEDWGQFSSSFGGQFFLYPYDKIGLGAELMYHYLFWYSVRVPYTYSGGIYREYSVNTVRLTPIVRIGGLNSFAFDMGPELNFLDGLSIGLLLSANYNIAINDKIAIPIKFRVDIIDYIKPVVPISLNTGIRLKL
ncbi:MAG: hypothetical protein MI922_08055 [Bacteroidales bacterium]|nr:hypothetical protein [Bacteroidales bacterium]